MEPQVDNNFHASGMPHFRALAQLTTGLALLLDAEGKVVETVAAKGFEGAAHFQGDEWVEAFAEADRPRLRRLITTALGADDPRTARAELWSGRHRAFREMEVTAQRVTPLGGPCHVVVAATDQTPARQAEETSKRQLAQRDATVREHRVRLRELSHRVKNDLQLVSGFLNSARDSASAESRVAFETASQRVRAIAQVYDRLTEYGDAERIDLRDLLRELAADAAKSLDVHPEVAADSAELTSSHAIILALVVNELLLNVAKHAYAPKGSRPVWVTARRQGQVIEIVVRDKGRGLPEGFEPLQLPKAGAQIVLSLVNRMGGRVTFNGASPGAEARILFPLA